ncbi:MAG: hypothetical protein IVW55_04060 [Chloroflexi bacterium]|nr:hypothetical protein [Chloroflexota bacterium]
MSVELKYLQVLYGTVGARDKFEEMCSLLIKGEYPDARAIRVYKGDGGVDQSVGHWDGHSPVAVFQQKYFPDRLGDTQKQEIRDSYRAAMSNGNFTLAKWTLCIPINLSQEEQRWWDEWKAKQEPTGQVIELWAAVDIVRLLMQSKNQGIKEAFFQQEHLAQIREVHQAVVGRGGASPGTDEERFAKQRVESISPLLQQAQSRGYWELMVHPHTFSQRRLPDMRTMHCVLEESAVRISSAWSIPTAEDLTMFDDWLSQDTAILFGPRVLRFYQSGQFVYTFSFVEDWFVPREMRTLEASEWEAGTGRYLVLGGTVTVLAALFLLAARLTQTEPYRGENVHLEVRATGLQGRSLYEPERHTTYGRATTPVFTYPRDYAPSHMASMHRQHALHAAAELFMRFGLRCSAPELEGYINIQAQN